MQKRISANDFFHAWVASVNEMKIILQDNWRNATQFTSLVKSSEDCVLKLVAKQLGLNCYPHDYYSLDSVLYRDCDLVPDLPEHSYWFRSLTVAFEHENSINSGIFKEVSHLLILDPELRVLVTYPISGIEEREWEYSHSIISGSRNADSISDQENFLVIFGGESGFVWEGYVYKKNGWKKLESRQN